MATPIRVGIIGVSADSSWARDAHVPAVQKLAGLELVGVASSNQARADDAAKAFSIKSAFASGMDLIRDHTIDLVAVCVRVPEHRELVMAAIEAGKHIYCEWPLGRNTAETEEMAAASQAAGIHAAIGLQTRANPAAMKARDSIASGAIGRVLSAHLYASTAGFGPAVPTPYLYLENPDNGVNLVTIQGAHAIDFALMVVGDLLTLGALNTTQYPEIEAGDSRTKRARVTFDHMLVQARLANGAALSIKVAGGRPPETPFQLEVVGDRGVLTLTGGAPRGFQSGRLVLLINDRAEPVDEGELETMPDSAANVAGIYAALRNDIQNGTFTVPDFQQAVRLSRLMDKEMLSARTGNCIHFGT